MSPERQQKTYRFLEIDSSVNELPYAVVVDIEKLDSMIKDVGIKSDALEKIKVSFLRKAPIKKYPLTGKWIFGEYNWRSQEIKIYLDAHWGELKKHLKKAEKISNRSRKPKRGDFTQLLTTRRLSKYLAEVPKERSLPFAEKLLWNGFERLAEHTVAHEVGHAVDYTNKNWKERAKELSPSISLLASVFFGLQVINTESVEPTVNGTILFVAQMTTLGYGLFGLILVPRGEKTADEWADRILENSEWQGFLSIQPRK